MHFMPSLMLVRQEPTKIEFLKEHTTFQAARQTQNKERAESTNTLGYFSGGSSAEEKKLCLAQVKMVPSIIQ